MDDFDERARQLAVKIESTIEDGQELLDQVDEIKKRSVLQRTNARLHRKF